MWPGASQWRIYCHFSRIQLSTTCSIATEAAKWAAPSYSRTQPATNNVVRDGRSNLTGRYPNHYRAVPPERQRHLHMQIRSTNQECSLWDSISDLWNTRPPHCQCGHSWYSAFWIAYYIKYRLRNNPFCISFRN